jgi:hypothetical protein
LRNPHNFPVRGFALKAEKKDQAVDCHSDWGPVFYDIGVFENCNENTNSHSLGFGRRYTNDTGLDGKTFFTGSYNFQAKEIEVFGISK